MAKLCLSVWGLILGESPARIACVLTIRQISMAKAAGPSARRTLFSSRAGAASAGLAEARYLAKASLAAAPKGTSRSLSPLPVHFARPVSKSRSASRSSADSEARHPVA